jgi:hypothetical protein
VSDLAPEPPGSDNADDRPVSPETREFLLEELERLRGELTETVELGADKLQTKMERLTEYGEELMPFMKTLPPL